MKKLNDTMIAYHSTIGFVGLSITALHEIHEHPVRFFQQRLDQSLSIIPGLTDGAVKGDKGARELGPDTLKAEK